MFTGIVQGIARVAALSDQAGLRSFTLAFPPGFCEGLAIGASVAVDGVCLTVTALPAPDAAAFDVMQQSLNLTTLAGLEAGSAINVERAARDGAEIGGHPLSGHVDVMARVEAIRRPENNHVLRIAVPAPWMRYVFAKGYIAVNGASLTVAEAQRQPDGSGWFEVWLIPETLRMTTFADKAEGAALNIEIERQTQVFVDTVRSAIEEKLGPLLPALEAFMRERGLALDELARPPQLPAVSLQRRSLLGLALAQAACSSAPPLLRTAAQPDVERFALGIASGQPHATGMVLWTALTGPELPPQVAVQWELAEDEAFTRIAARGAETALLDDAHTVHAEPSGLPSDRWYWYRFRALGAQSPVGRTRTAPAPGALVQRLDFAIASCQRWDTGHYAAWRHAAAENLDLVLFLGDYIYEYASNEKSLRATDDPKPVRTLEAFRRRYALHKSDPALRAAHAAAPWLLVWDDHEVENDYAGLQGNRLQPDFAAQRAAAYRAYWEFMPLPKAARPRDANLRMHGRLDWGALARVHLLDDRQYRDPQACQRPGRGGSGNVVERDCAALTDPARTLLGAAQERWLAEGWSLHQPWNLVAQQTLMARFGTTAPADGGGTYWSDGWDGYPAARRRLLAPVAERRVPGVVVLGGDVHANYVADLHLDFDRPAALPLATEFCGTSISSLGLAQSWVDDARRFAPHVRYGRSDQRGYVRFTLQPRELRAELRVLDDGRRADSAVATAARFVVDAARPGAMPA